MNQLKSGLLLLLFTFSIQLYAQKQKQIIYTPTEVLPNDLTLLGTPQITASEYRMYQINVEELETQLTGIAYRDNPSEGFTAMISFPHPDGSMHQYQAMGNQTLSPELGAKFPEIKTYDALDNEGRKVKWDITPKGLHVMILQAGESTIFIDPIIDGNDQYYMVYYKKDFATGKNMNCEFGSEEIDLNPQKKPVSGSLRTFGTCELRTYRLALAATGEYTAYHGGTVADAQAAQATTMNRVNGVYERDMAITMVIIGNNDQIIYTNGATDPYSNGNAGTMLGENQSTCDAVIGNGNYDIGHVFGTNSGGVAYLGCVCNNTYKARGVTGSANPIGDPFDIDYVAHEMGHQFGANHTQNNGCNRNNATAMEPGSASTIMGYAGICAPNVQSNSDDHFHGINLEEIGIEIMSAGHTCEQITALGNNAPVINSTNGNITIPTNTPFALTGNVTDADGDPILYCWEQIDNAVSVQPPNPSSTDGPNFRSNSPVPDATRYFPNLPDLTAGISPTWEVIPSVSRTMNFRLTVRDQGLNVPGCNDHEDVTVTFDDGSGPFVVLYPSITGIVWTGSTSETVTWDVANTNLAPVNCSTVDILLSTDGGLTYPTTLATAVANDGAETITVPGIVTTTARIMVRNSDGTFFDISDNDFEIDAPACTDPDVPTLSGATSICEGQSTTLSISSGNLNDATDWQWYTTSCGGTSVGSGTAITVSPTSTTSYFVRGEGGCVTPGSCEDIEVQVNPVYNLNETASICDGDTYTYPDGTTGTVTESHSSNLTTVDGCDSVIVTDLTVNPLYNENESVTICDGDTYTYPDGTTGTVTESHSSNLTTVDGCDSVIVTDLTVNPLYNENESATICDGDTYTFPDGTTGTTPQTQTSVLTDVNGCDSTIVTTLTVTTIDVTVNFLSPGLEANQTTATYQWVDCDNGNATIAGETNQVFIPTEDAGNYAVIITMGGCQETSSCYIIDQTGMDEWSKYNVNLYPNPSSGLVYINWEGKVLSIELTDARGRILTAIDTEGMNGFELDVSDYSKGVYFIHLYTEQGRMVKELIRQ